MHANCRTMKTPNLDELSSRIEQLVQEHLVACRTAAQVAVQRAFSTAMAAPGMAKVASPAGKERRPARRRNLAELAALGEKLHAAVCAAPGESMATLSARVGVCARDLHRPMALLKRSGRVSHVGARGLARYFPLAADGS
jgi:hypothetical protein